MSDRNGCEAITVKEFALAQDLGLNLEVIQWSEGEGRKICSPRIQKMGLAFAGYTAYIHPDRVQVLGASECSYLESLDPRTYEDSFANLRAVAVCCVVITRGLDAPAGLSELAIANRFALLRTRELSSVAIQRISGFLETRLAPRTTIHGVFMEVFGLGVLILGPSGIGKSECALELVLKGHRLIADDSVELTRRGIGALIGKGTPVLKHHMEIRGLGVIDIKELFGISATGQAHGLDFIVQLDRWKPDSEYDRLGIDQTALEILGTAVPVINMPVAPGRNIATLVEVAARTQLLRKRGLPLSRELLDRQPNEDDRGPSSQPCAGERRRP